MSADTVSADAVSAHAARLERLWSSDFGDAYTRRNAIAQHQAGVWHHDLGQRLGVRRVLEVGCNLGLNLTRMAADDAFRVCGVDVCPSALRQAAGRLGEARFVRGSAYRLPFADGAFDLVFTCGVLIHLSPEALPRALAELNRVSADYVWMGEYHSDVPVEILYRGESEALFKRDFGAAFVNSFPNAIRVDRGYLEKTATGFDNLTWWLFQKP